MMPFCSLGAQRLTAFDPESPSSESVYRILCSRGRARNTKLNLHSV